MTNEREIRNLFRYFSKRERNIFGVYAKDRLISEHFTSKKDQNEREIRNLFRYFSKREQEYLRGLPQR